HRPAPPKALWHQCIRIVAIVVDDASQPVVLIVAVHGGWRVISRRTPSVLGTPTWQEQEDGNDDEQPKEQQKKQPICIHRCSSFETGSPPKNNTFRGHEGFGNCPCKVRNRSKKWHRWPEWYIRTPRMPQCRIIDRVKM